MVAQAGSLSPSHSYSRPRPLLEVLDLQQGAFARSILHPYDLIIRRTFNVLCSTLSPAATALTPAETNRPTAAGGSRDKEKRHFVRILMTSALQEFILTFTKESDRDRDL